MVYIRSSEMTKYAVANSMLATRISFMNKMVNICDRLGADIMMVMRCQGSDLRIGPKFLLARISMRAWKVLTTLRTLMGLPSKTLLRRW